MPFLVNDWHGLEGSEVEARILLYREYLDSVRNQLPASAFEFATAPWHYDYRDPRAPQDSWLEMLTIHEMPSGERPRIRTLEIVIQLLGAYHDGHTVLTYHDLRNYSLLLNGRSGPPAGHDDLLVDEFAVSSNGFFVHTLLFASGGCFSIEAREFDWSWRRVNEAPLT